MTSVRQIEANRRNAQKSTGPQSKEGKQRAAQNALRHGLTAETVVLPLEDPEDYKAFEQAVAADYDGATAVERELILRLASLLWRLRRATSIETGLLQIQARVLRRGRQGRQVQQQPKSGSTLALVCLRESAVHAPPPAAAGDCSRKIPTLGNDLDTETPANRMSSNADPHLEVARCFSWLVKVEPDVFERLGRYEVALWRQVRQLIFTLDALRGRGFHYRTRLFWQKSNASIRDIHSGDDP